jgi:two-component system nitrate/nitrite response regulator NarL
LVRRYSVVIADRHPVVLGGLMTVLGGEADFNVVASCQNGETCIKAIRELSPGLALLGIELPQQGGLRVLAAISSEHLSTRLVYLSPLSDPSETAKAIAAAPQSLVRCLRDVASGQRPSPLFWDLGAQNEDENGPRAILDNVTAPLTALERQIVDLMGKGLANEEIGRQLGLPEDAIKVRLHRIYLKLAIHNRAALTVRRPTDLRRDPDPDPDPE